MRKFQKLYERFEARWACTSKTRYIAYLRRKGIIIGDNLWITRDLRSLHIDITRPSLIEIGNHVRLNTNLSILTHDGGFWVLRYKYKEFIPTSGKVKIGNNVYFARNCSVFKGVTIGDNCIIGYGSVVTRDIPENSVAVGAPARVVCTLDEYYNKRKKLSIEEAFLYARSIKERFNRRPVIEDFWEEFPLFMNGDEEHSGLPIKRQLKEAYNDYKRDHKAIFNGFEDFLKKAGL